MNIPKDPYMLLSYINTMLRDKYISLEDLCASLSIEQEKLEHDLKTIDYSYDKKLNRFIAI